MTLTELRGQFIRITRQYETLCPASSSQSRTSDLQQLQSDLAQFRSRLAGFLKSPNPRAGGFLAKVDRFISDIARQQNPALPRNSVPECKEIVDRMREFADADFKKLGAIFPPLPNVTPTRDRR